MTKEQLEKLDELLEMLNEECCDCSVEKFLEEGCECEKVKQIDKVIDIVQERLNK